MNQLDANRVLDARRLIRNYGNALTDLDAARVNANRASELSGAYRRHQEAYDAILAALTKC